MTLNEFAGPFKIRDHSLIPGTLLNFLSERFYSATRLSRVPIEDINAALNEVWKGPGSLELVETATRALRTERLAKSNTTASSVEPVKTIDDHDSNDFSYAFADDEGSE